MPQGDEPLIKPGAIDKVAQTLISCPDADLSTLSAPLTASELLSTSAVKVVCSPLGQSSTAERALFFSRAPIGVDREFLGHLLSGHSGEKTSLDMLHKSAMKFACRLHVGIYAFRPLTLQRFVQLPLSRLESFEKLEQMRALEAGMQIVVSHVGSYSRGIDTQEDLDAARRTLAESVSESSQA